LPSPLHALSAVYCITPIQAII
jgi:hypothetical protein